MGNRDAYRVLGQWEDPGVDKRIILKWGLEKWDGSKEVSNFNTLPTGDADLRFYATTVQDG